MDVQVKCNSGSTYSLNMIFGFINEGPSLQSIYLGPNWNYVLLLYTFCVKFIVIIERWCHWCQCWFLNALNIHLVYIAMHLLRKINLKDNGFDHDTILIWFSLSCWFQRYVADLITPIGWRDMNLHFLVKEPQRRWYKQFYIIQEN